MSRFLAPIHTWVYNKIKIQEDLEANLVEEFGKQFGGEIQTIWESARKTYGEPLGDKPIEEVIDTGNIHGWLQGRIDMVEPRMAFILTEVINKFGVEAETAAMSIFRNHGKDYGSNAKDSFPVATAPEIYKALNSYLLEGMPCDIVNTVTISESEKLQWKNMRCLHIGYWEKVNGNTDLMYDLRNSWIKSFIEAANINFTFNVTKSEENGSSIFINEIAAR